MTSTGSTRRRDGSSTKDPESGLLGPTGENVPTNGRLRPLVRYAFERTCVLRSVKIALVVGTVLALINHFNAIIGGSLDAVSSAQILLTYFVPYTVATIGSAAQAVQMEDLSP